MAEKQERTQTTKTTRDLMVTLTDDEKREYGRKLADLEHDREAVETEKKAAADGFKERLSAIQVGIGRLVSTIRDGVERREVECEWVFYWDSLTKELSRADTGEVIERAVIGPDERQIGLNGIDNNP